MLIKWKFVKNSQFKKICCVSENFCCVRVRGKTIKVPFVIHNFHAWTFLVFLPRFKLSCKKPSVEEMSKRALSIWYILRLVKASTNFVFRCRKVDTCVMAKESLSNGARIWASPWAAPLWRSSAPAFIINVCSCTYNLSDSSLCKHNG